MVHNYREDVELLVRNGLNSATAKNLFRSGALPAPLNDSMRRNAEFLGRFIPLNEIENVHLLSRFIMRDHALNQEMAALADAYELPPELRTVYFSNPTDWCRSAADMRQAEEGLRLLTTNEGAIRGILHTMLTNEAYLCGGEALSACCALAEINTMPPAMEAYLEAYDFIIFSCYSDLTGCLKLLTDLVGRENALSVLIRYPALPRTLSKADHFIDWERNYRRLREALHLTDPSEPPLPLNEAEKLQRIQELTAGDAEYSDVRSAVAAIIDQALNTLHPSNDNAGKRTLLSMNIDSILSALRLLHHCGKKYGLEFPDGENAKDAALYIEQLIREASGYQT